MALRKTDILKHNNPNLAVVDSDFVSGGFRTGVANISDLYSLSNKINEVSAIGQVKEHATIVYVSGETKYYILNDITNINNLNGWKVFDSGSIGVGLVVFESVLVATTNNITLSGLQTIDNIQTFNGNRVLVKNQTNPIDNGIYVVSSGTWSRALDYDLNPNGEVSNGNLIPVMSGASQNNSLWALTTINPINVGDELIFTLFQIPTKYDNGVGININENIINVNGGSLSGDYINWNVITKQFNVDANAIVSGYTTLINFNNYTGATQSILNNIITGVTNLGTGVTFSLGISNKNLQLNTLKGSGNTSITKVGDDIIVYSSGDTNSGTITGGTNIGSGQEIYGGVIDKDLIFRKIIGSGGTTISTVNDSIIINSINNSNGGVNGSVFITNIIPQSSGNVGAKTFSSDGVVLDNCTTDTQLVSISVLALPGNTNYKPVIMINSLPVIMVAQLDKPLFVGTINFDLSNATELTVIHEDGAQHTTYITQDTPPLILTAYFVGGYPGSQTELKENDVFDFHVESDVPIIAIQLDNFEAYKSGTFPVSSGTIHTITGIIANRGTTTLSQRGRVRVQKSTGGWSNWFTTSIGVNGTGHVMLNNRYPTINFGVINYPPNQLALKNNETVNVNHVVNYADSSIYSSPNSELLITNPNTYEVVKTVQRISGGYNIATNNLTITANRVANNATTVGSTVVWIANDSQVISINSPTRLRSGGNDGTISPNHVITINSNQRLISAPSLVAPIGTWQGGGFSWTAAATSFTRELQIHDNLTKGIYGWGVLSTTNLAGRVVTTISGNNDYVLGGFLSRDIPLTAFLSEAIMNVQATDYSKVTLSWTFEPLLINRELLNSVPIITNGWALVALNTNPTTIRILDAKTSASTQESMITIQEGI